MGATRLSPLLTLASNLVPAEYNGTQPDPNTCFGIVPTVQVVLGVGGGSLLLEWPQQQEPALQDLTVGKRGAKGT